MMPISFEAAKLSRADVHIDYQGGYAPSLANVSEELRCFIRPGKTKGALYFQGSRPTGYAFGKGHVQARLYNKTLETKEKANDSYAALLLAKNGEAYDPEQDVWRLEFQLRREGAKGFKLYAPPEEDDDEAEIEAELAAEELQHIGTLPRFFARMNELVLFLTQHWLRLVEDNGSANRSRWPTHPTWLALREQFATVAQAQPLDEDQRRLGAGIALQRQESSPASHGAGGGEVAGGRGRLADQRRAHDIAALDGEGRGEGGGAHHRQVSALSGAARLLCHAGSSVGWANGSRELSSWSIGCRCCWASSRPKACCLSSSSRPIQLATCSPNTSMNWSRRLNAKEELCRCLLITLRAFIRYQVLSRWSRRIRRTLLTRQSPSDQRTS